MRLEFKDIINKEKGKTAFVLGLGFSLKKHLPMLLELQHDKEKYCIISVNNIDRICPELFEFDYWILAQPAEQGSDFYIPNAYKRYNRNPRTTFLYTDCLDLTPRDEVARLLNVNYIGYEQRHWNSEPCHGNQKCCKGIIKGRLAIQEEFRDYTQGEMYGAGDTVGIHAVVLACLLGCKDVFVTGIDLDYTNGYANNDLPETRTRVRMGMSSMNNTPRMVDRVLKDMAIVRDNANKVGTEIYCMDEGLKISNIFKHKTFSFEEAR